MTRAGALILMAALGCASQPQGEPRPAPRSGDYLGEPLPGDRPVIFAAGLISTDLRQRDTAISPDGRFLFFSTSRTDPPPPGIRRSYETIVRELREPDNGQGSLYWMETRGLFQPRGQTPDP